MTNLTQTERDQLAQSLLADQASINTKLAALGIAAKPKDPEKSPDGGPPSFIHQNPNFNTTLRKLVPVYKLNGNGEKNLVLIHRDQFNSSLHEWVEEEEEGQDDPTQKRIRRDINPDSGEGDAVPKRSRVKLDPGKFGIQQRSELLTLSMDVLAVMPEVVAIEEVPTEKSRLVDAILAVRGEFID